MEKIDFRGRRRGERINLLTSGLALLLLLTSCVSMTHEKSRVDRLLFVNLPAAELEKALGSPFRRYTPAALKSADDPKINVSLSTLYGKLNEDVSEIWIYEYIDKNMAFKSKGFVFVLISPDKKVSDWQFIHSEFERGILLDEKNN